MAIHPYFSMAGDEAKGLLFGLLESNKIQLRKYPGMPSIRQLVQEGRIRYERADPQEHWQTYKELVDQVEEYGVAKADCEDLATAIAAEDQVKYGVQSVPFAYSPKPGLFHVVTAVPREAFGRIPSGRWPGALGAPPMAGYEFQDPSAAAGMGSSFGYAPSGGSMYGGDGFSTRRQGLGGVARSLQEGLAGGGSIRDTAREIGAGARSAIGLERGWARELGEQLPGALGLPTRKIRPSEDAAVSAMRKGAQAQEDEDSEDLDLEEDDEDDEEFGLLAAPVGSGPWWLEATSDKVVDAMFGADDDVDDDEYGVISSRLSREPSSLAHEDFGAVATLGRMRRGDLFGSTGDGGFRFIRDDDEV